MTNFETAPIPIRVLRDLRTAADLPVYDRHDRRTGRFTEVGEPTASLQPQGLDARREIEKGGEGIYERVVDSQVTHVRHRRGVEDVMVFDGVHLAKSEGVHVGEVCERSHGCCRWGTSVHGVEGEGVNASIQRGKQIVHVAALIVLILIGGER